MTQSGSVNFSNNYIYNPRLGYYIFKIQINSEPYQGGDDDDTTLNNVRFWCRDSRSEIEIREKNMLSEYIDYEGFRLEEPKASMWGKWTAVKSCPDYYGAVGLQLRMEGGQGRGDDTALGEIRLICAPIDKFYGVTITD